jgi:AbrB family looped-hinge helix DNA binding protein
MNWRGEARAGNFRRANPIDTTVTDRGAITIPKQIRDSVGLGPGCEVDVVVNHKGEVVLRKHDDDFSALDAEFDLAIGSADVKWRTTS